MRHQYSYRSLGSGETGSSSSAALTGGLRVVVARLCVPSSAQARAALVSALTLSVACLIVIWSAKSRAVALLDGASSVSVTVPGTSTTRTQWANDGCLKLSQPSSASEKARAATEAYGEPSSAQLFCARDELLESGTFGSRACAASHDEERDIDVVWTWTNGSETLMSAWREDVIRKRRGEGDEGKGNRGGVLESVRHRWLRLNAWWAGRTGNEAGESARQFRDHDELRYSFRSAIDALPHSRIRSFHLIVGDTPATLPGEPATDERCAQIPRWLDKDQLAKELDGMPQLHIEPHSSLFAGSRAAEEDLVPAFNSLAIEAQMGNIENLSSSFMYLNDDHFLVQSLEVADMSTPMTGPVLRFIKHDTVAPKSPAEIASWPEKDRTSEWKGLALAAHALDQRFGKRERPYVTHIAKTLSTPILREAMHVFSELFEGTSMSRFRGDSDVEIQPAFLVAHYLVEKHRETLLWSFIVAKSDADHDGTLNALEKDTVLRGIGWPDRGGQEVQIRRPERSSLADLQERGYFAQGLSPPAQTALRFTSMDGYAYEDVPRVRSLTNGDTWPTFDDSRGPDRCTISHECFPETFWSGEANAEDVLKHVAFERPRCGDCLIRAVVSRSGLRGLAAFLPLASLTPTEAYAQPIALENTYEAASFATESTDWRSLATSLIARYSYVVGDSPFRFKRVSGPGSALVGLHHIRQDPHYRCGLLCPTSRRPPAFLAINDDMGEHVSMRSLERVNSQLEAFFEETFPSTSPYEAS